MGRSISPRLPMRLAALEGRRALVSLMLANNETGVVQPVCEAARLTHEAGGLLHVDAVQAAGRIPCDINAIGADLLTLSGHKIGAPKGVGRAGQARRGAAVSGSADQGRRPGARRAGRHRECGRHRGFGAAAAAALVDLGADAGRHERRCATGSRPASGPLRPSIVVFGAEAERLPNTTLFAVPGMKAETAVIAFDLEGVAVSSGAACSSGKVAPSHVLAAMGVPAELARARGARQLGSDHHANPRSIARSRLGLKALRALPKETRGIAA